VKQAIRSTAATADVAAAIGHYLNEAPHVAVNFVGELERAVRHIERHPSSGSPRYAHELDIPQLRHWPLRRFPFALFYVEDVDRLVIMRCVHMTRDIPASLRDES
jgi:toxin ParE1/3/4